MVVTISEAGADPANNAATPLRVVKIKPLAGASLYDLVETEVGGALAYVSVGPDPQMVLCEPDTETPLRLAPGRYRFFFQARLTKGRFYRSRLYLNAGEGFSEAEHLCVFLQQSAPDLWYGDIYAKRPIVEIRFDPSEAPVRFTLIRLALEEWGTGRLSVSENLYRFNRAIYRSLPRFLTKGGPIPWTAERVAHGLFDQARKNLREREIAAVTSIPVAEGPINPKRSAFAGSDLYADQYKEALGVSEGARDPSFAPIAHNPTTIAADDAKVLAFYLPQFHSFPENDEWWGRGFTEWTNVSKAVPHFEGHYQPRLPGELGFYDLRLPEIMARQFELARMFGIHGFCFHYYWFDGKRLLERPIETLLARKDDAFNFPFCLCWANENWTRRWDGAEHDVLMQQSHSHEDHERVFDDLLRYLKDPRYICVDGKPVIVIYRPLIIATIADMVSTWRRKAAEAGLPGVYLVATTAFGFSDPAQIGFDALCQFPPHAVAVPEITKDLQLLNPGFAGCVYDYRETVDAYVEILDELKSTPPKTAYFPGVMTAWDNVARKVSRGHVFHKASPREFHRWLAEAVEFTRSINKEGEKFVFVNAWNEWGEGTYLEPDRKFGYAYLWAVAAAQRQWHPQRAKLEEIADKIARTQKPSSDAVIYLHIFYEDLIDEFAEAIARAQESRSFDVIVTIPESWTPETAARLVELLKPVRLLVVENRGRDVLPFFRALRATMGFGYKYGCKLHSKKSQHLRSGSRWRRGLVEGIIGPAAVQAAFDAFDKDPKSGFAAPKEAFMSANDPAAMRDNRANVEMLLNLVERPDVTLEDFVAGTMFWFRIEAFESIAALPIDKEEFGAELGAIDGTLAHAFERAFPTLVTIGGYHISQYEHDGNAAAPY